jgi:hypothetical protein
MEWLCIAALGLAILGAAWLIDYFRNPYPYE